MILSNKKNKSLQKKACERYENLAEEEKSKKHQYGCELHQNLSEKELKKASLWS